LIAQEAHSSAQDAADNTTAAREDHLHDFTLSGELCAVIKLRGAALAPQRYPSLEDKDPVLARRDRLFKSKLA
jgi:hypothetical protein